MFGVCIDNRPSGVYIVQIRLYLNQFRGPDPTYGLLTLLRPLYKNALHESAALEELADAVDQLARNARRQARANPRLSAALEGFASGLCRLFDHRLYPELIRSRAAIEDHEERVAREALRVAPKFARRVMALRRTFRTGREDDA